MKKIFAFLLTLLLLVGLGACAQGKGASSAGASADISAENTPEETESDETPMETQTEETPTAAEAETPQPLSLSTNTERQDEWDGDVHLCYVEWSSLSLSEPDDDAPVFGGADFPELAAALEEMNEETGQNVQEALDTLLSEADEAYADYDYFYTFYLETELTVTRADSRALSFLCCSSSYEGGTHESYSYGGVTFDPETGSILTLDDVLSDASELPELLESLLTAKYADTHFFDLQETFEDYLADDAFSWTLGYQGITFYFSPYEIASFADGLLTVTILFDNMPGLFESEYTEVPTSYAVPLRLVAAWPASLSGLYDLDGDGETDELCISAQLDEYDYYSSFGITLNGSTLAEKYYAYELTPYLVHTANGKSFLYVESLSDSDYETLSVYDLNGDAPVFVGELDGSGFHSSWSETTGLQTDLLTDPEYFILDTRINLLSTMSGTRTYYTDGRDGMPVPVTPYYTLNDGFVLESKISLELSLPEEGITEAFPAGTRFTCFRTDNATYMDMKLDDGRICRVDVEADNGQMTVDSMDIYDVFDGMLFAG